MSRTAAKPKPTAALCCVTINYVSFLLPAEAGLKVVALLRGAHACSADYDRGDHSRFYALGDELEVEYIAVKAAQVRAPRADIPPAPLAIGREPLKLTHG